MIHRHSGDLPRVVNNVATDTPLMGFSRDLLNIGPDIILDVVEDLDLEPV